MSAPEFADLATFIRKWAQVPAEISIRPDTLFERDLGITGDDGEALLIAVQKHLGIQLWTDQEVYRNTFGLKKHEYLFNSEAYPIWDSCRLFKSQSFEASQWEGSTSRWRMSSGFHLNGAPQRIHRAKRTFQ